MNQTSKALLATFIGNTIFGFSFLFSKNANFFTTKYWLIQYFLLKISVSNYIIKSGMSVGVMGSVVNEKTDSSKDTYSCDYINSIINQMKIKSIITGYYTGNSDNTGDISFNSFVKNGENIIGLEEKITVKGLSKVKVSASITAQTTTSQAIGLTILKNDSLFWQSFGQSYSINGSQIEISIPPILVEVSNDDVFKLSISGSCKVRKGVMTIEEVAE